MTCDDVRWRAMTCDDVRRRRLAGRQPGAPRPRERPAREGVRTLLWPEDRQQRHRGHDPHASAGDPRSQPRAAVGAGQLGVLTPTTAAVGAGQLGVLTPTTAAVGAGQLGVLTPTTAAVGYWHPPQPQWVPVPISWVYWHPPQPQWGTDTHHSRSGCLCLSAGCTDTHHSRSGVLKPTTAAVGTCQLVVLTPTRAAVGASQLGVLTPTRAAVGVSWVYWHPPEPRWVPVS